MCQPASQRNIHSSPVLLQRMDHAKGLVKLLLWHLTSLRSPSTGSHTLQFGRSFCCILSHSSPHLMRKFPLEYGYFVDIPTFPRKFEISDKTRTQIPIWRRFLVMRQRPRMDASGRSSSVLCDLTWHAIGGCDSNISQSNEAMASNSCVSEWPCSWNRHPCL